MGRPLANIFLDIKNNGDARENAINELISLWDAGEIGIKKPPAEMIDRLYKKGCSSCGNDLVPPYNYCRFCGVAIKMGEKNGINKNDVK